MYYKVLKNDTVIDILTMIRYVRYQKKHNQILLCEPQIAEAILSSNGEYGWHIEGLYSYAPDNTVYKIEKIPKYEYDAYKRELGMEA